MGKKLRIALYSGPADYSVALANALSEHCEVSYFYNGRFLSENESILRVLSAKIKVVPINNIRIRDLRNVYYFFQIAKKMRRYDVVHIQQGYIWLALWRFMFKDIPIVYTVHDPYQHEGLKAANKMFQDIGQRIMISQSSKYFVHGELMKKKLEQRYKINKRDITSIPHGNLSFYIDFFKKVKSTHFEKNNHRKRILFFGSVRENKGLEYLIRAEPLVSEKFKNIEFFIAGKFPGNLDKYECLIKNKDRFTIIDKYIPNHDVRSIFESSDIVVLPYVSASQSGVLSLAFTFGKCVVATNTGSIGEVIENGKNGILVPPCDEKSLAGALLDLLQDDERRLGLGRNAKETADCKMNWEHIAIKTIEIYRNVTRECS